MSLPRSVRQEINNALLDLEQEINRLSEGEAARRTEKIALLLKQNGVVDHSNYYTRLNAIKERKNERTPVCPPVFLVNEIISK